MPLHVVIHSQPGSDWPVTNLDEAAVRKRFVEPWLHGEAIVARGRHFNAGAYWFSVYEAAKQSPTRDDIKTVVGLRFNAKEVTDDYVTAPFGAELPRQAPAEAYADDRRKIMVVHGRDRRLRVAMFDFLRSVDLRPLEWAELVGSVNVGAPYIGEVLDTAFEQAQAVVVLFTPDDAARLRADLIPPDDPDDEATEKGQPRPNGFLEAGMAVGRFPTRTVFAEVGTMRPASDLAGRHAVRLDNGPECRTDLAQRLESAGCLVNSDGTDWLSAGDFSSPPPHGAGGQPASSGLLRRTEALRADLGDQDGFVAWGVAEAYNKLLDDGDVHDLPRAERQERSSVSGRMSRSRMTGQEMRIHLGQLRERLL